MALSIVIASLAAYESIRLLFLLGVLFCWLLYKRKAVLFSVLAVLLGISSYYYFGLSIPQPAKEVSVTEITWTDVYKINGRYIRGFVTADDQQKWYVQLKIASEEEKNALLSESLAGKLFRVEAQEIEEQAENHEYAFQMESYIKSNGAVGQLLVENYQYAGEESSFVSYMAKKRFQTKQHIQATFPNSLQAEAEALLIGSREQMPTDMQNAYQTLGITHLFAISGLHVALIALLMYEALIRVGVRKETANWILLIILPLYAFLAGGAPSVWRSVSVTEIVLISMLCKKKLAMDDAFSLSVIGFVWLNPWVIFQIGFQLSYLAAFSLIYSSSILKNSTSYMIQSLVITTLCQLIVYPILLYQFYEISLSSFLANIVFVPLFSFVILPINIIFLAFSYISISLSDFFFSFYEPLRTLLSEFILFLGSLPYQMWNPMKPTLPLVLLAFASVFVFFLSFETKKNQLFGCVVLLLPMMMIHITPYLDSSTKITFLNVGQGDSAIIEMPHRKEVIMIDTGGLLRFDQEPWTETNEAYEIGGKVVVPFLKGRGISKIDTLVITHADADHMEGAEEILEQITVKEIHITPSSYDKDVMGDVKEEINKQQIPVIEKIAGDQIESAYYQLHYISPEDSVYDGNNDSLVLSMKNAYFHGLFLGDLEKEGEEELVRKYQAALRNVSLLKIGHHGSKTSSSQALLELTNPRISIISAGYNNRYGHPHPEVVERLQALKLPFLQTGIEGSIEVEITKAGETYVSIP